MPGDGGVEEEGAVTLKEWTIRFFKEEPSSADGQSNALLTVGNSLGRSADGKMRQMLRIQRGAILGRDGKAALLAEPQTGPYSLRSPWRIVSSKGKGLAQGSPQTSSTYLLTWHPGIP